MSRKEGFLDRWSRMKQTEDLPPEALEVEPSASNEVEEDERSDEEILEELGLIDPDELKPGDDFTGFMAKAVPDRLRRRALRQLWRSNPVLANVDGLVEYGEDYTDSAMVVENMQTLYQVGKGMFVREPEVDPADLEDESADAPEAVAEEAEPQAISSEEVDDVERENSDPELHIEADEVLAAGMPDAYAPALATRRRMQFS